MTWNNTQPSPTQLVSQGQGTILNNMQFLGSTTGNAANGYYKLPNGLILNWGRISVTTSGTKSQSYPQAYTTAVYNVQFSLGYKSAGDLISPTVINPCIDTSSLPLSLSSVSIRVNAVPTTPSVDTLYIYWFAIGV